MPRHPTTLKIPTRRSDRDMLAKAGECIARCAKCGERRLIPYGQDYCDRCDSINISENVTLYLQDKVSNIRYSGDKDYDSHKTNRTPITSKSRIRSEDNGSRRVSAEEQLKRYILNVISNKEFKSGKSRNRFIQKLVRKHQKTSRLNSRGKK